MSSAHVPPSKEPSGSWTFITNHAAVLLCIATNPTIRGREIADRVGITERAAQRIVGDLVAEGFVTRKRVGRRNEYVISRSHRMRHRLARHKEVGDLLEVLLEGLPDVEPSP